MSDDRALDAEGGWLVAALPAFVAFAILGVVNVALFAAHAGHHAAGLVGLALFCALFQYVTAGVVAGIFLALAARRALLPVELGALCFVATCTLVGLSIRDELPGLKPKLAELLHAPTTVVEAGLALAAGLLVLASIVLALFAARRRATAIGAAALGLLVLAAHVSISPSDNPGFHLVASHVAAILLVPGASYLVRVSGLSNRISSTSLRMRSAGLALVVLACAVAWAAPVWRSHALLLERRWCGNVYAAFMSVRAQEVHVSADTRRSAGPFFQSRTKLRPIPPTPERVLPVENPIVLLVTIDALRWDLIERAEHPESVANLLALESRAIDFTNARAPGSQTVYSLTTLSTGRYFSQQRWTPLDRGELWPHQDKQKHFASLLQRAGVKTVLVQGTKFMSEQYGVLRGFSVAGYIKDGSRQWGRAPVLADKLIQHLQHFAGEAPLFLYLHFFDPHEPYTRGNGKGSRFDKYLAELRYVDQQIGRILAALEAPELKRRTLLIVSADHGEAFGEHESTGHATTLYDELLRVPLLVVGPATLPRKIDTPVGLIDLGPTVLDVFGCATPAAFMGQSLTPFLVGKTRTFQRPLLAEGRLKQALVLDDGTKVVRDLRQNTTEIYDLRSDPLELDNLDLSTEPRHQRAKELLELFFQVHTLRKNGYKVPMRK